MRLGRPLSINPKEAQRLRSEGQSLSQIAKALGATKSGVSKTLKKLRSQLPEIPEPRTMVLKVENTKVSSTRLLPAEEKALPRREMDCQMASPDLYDDEVKLSKHLKQLLFERRMSAS